MRQLSEKHAPGLFDVLLQCITHDDSRLSQDHQLLQEQRVAALLHILANFRNSEVHYKAFQTATQTFCLEIHQSVL